MKQYPKILVISNNCFSLSNSNGRTLGGFFLEWPKEKLAQFCISFYRPNYDLCNNYYCVTDIDATKAFLFYPLHTNSKYKNSTTSNVPTIRKPNKTALSMSIRNIIWNSGRWKKGGFEKWVDDYSPELVLFQSGDSIFMCKIALDIVKRKNIPLLVFNTEGYYFFNKSWFNPHWTDFFIFPIFNSSYKKHFRLMMKCVSHTIYCNSLLKKDYDKEFNTNNSSVLYTSSNLPFVEKDFNKISPIFSYLGNLGLSRPFALIEIAEALYSINPEYKLNVYGKLPIDLIHIFDGYKSINYCGLVDYQKVIDIMQKSDVLFHVEYSKGEWIRTLKYSFSTKIADSLASGTNFLLYAPRNLTCSQYIIDSKGAWYVDKKIDLVPTLNELITNAEKRRKYILKAKDLVLENHNPTVNIERFYSIVFNLFINNKKNN